MSTTRQTVLATLILLALIGNLGFNAVLYKDVIENQRIITDNQLQISMQLQAYEDYFADITAEYTETASTQDVVIDIHLRSWVHDKDGNLKAFHEGAGVLTNIGKDHIEKQLSGTVNASEIAKYISLTANATAPDATCVNLKPEIAANNMSRAAGTYASTGVGTWTVTYIFTASGTQAVTVAGLNWDDDGVNHLLCTDDITDATLEDDDTLTLEWSLSVV